MELRPTSPEYKSLTVARETMSSTSPQFKQEQQDKIETVTISDNNKNS